MKVCEIVSNHIFRCSNVKCECYLNEYTRDDGKNIRKMTSY